MTVGLAKGMFTASYFIAWCFARYMGRSANKTRLAFAMVASSSVGADRRRSTRIGKALVEIHAFGTNGFETILAEALSLDALGIVDAIEIRFAESRHIGLIARDCRAGAGTVPRRAEAIVTRLLVLANRISTTRILQSRTLVDVVTT